VSHAENRENQDQVGKLVVTTLRARERTCGVASVTIVPMGGPAGAWKVQTFEEGSSSRGGCLLGLRGLIPVLQTRFELGL
jgi:hypothetical protein